MADEQNTNQDSAKKKTVEEEKADQMLKENQPAGAEEKTTTEADVAEFEDFDEAHTFNPDTLNKLDYLNDLQLNVYIELGRTQMKIKEILELERGYVIELDKLASEPVDIFVNNKKIAEGEVVVIDKHFGIRIVGLVDTKKMMKGLT